MTRRSALAFSADQSAGQALSALRHELAANQISGAALEARCLVEAVCGFDRARLVSQAHHPLGMAAPRLAALAARRLAGEPLARLLGARESLRRYQRTYFLSIRRAILQTAKETNGSGSSLLGRPFRSCHG